MWGIKRGAATLLLFSGGSLTSGSPPCSFDVTIDVPAGVADGSYFNVTSSLSATQGDASVVIDPAADQLVIDSDLLQLTKVFTDDPVAPGGSVTLEFTLTNLRAVQAAAAIAFTDDLGAALSGLTFDSVLLNTCGATVSGVSTTMIDVSGASLGAGASCVIRTSLSVPGGALGGTYTNTTSGVTGTIGGLSVFGGPDSDDLEVTGLLSFSKAFDGPTTATGTPTLTFTITNANEDTASGLTFSDDLSAVITGLVATNLPLSDVCGAGSLLSGTSLLTLSGGKVDALSSCEIVVELLVPGAVTPGTYPNTTSALRQNGLPVAAPATASLSIESPPTFAKVFAPGTIPAGEASTLTFTIDNSDSDIAASSLSFTDNLPGNVKVAVPPNASTTCTGGTLTAAAASGSITYTGGSVAAGGTCTVTVNVTSATAGSFLNTTGDLTSSLGNSGKASATLRVNPRPAFSKTFTPRPIFIGGVSTLILSINNTNSTVAATSLSVTDNLPAGLVVATPPSASTTCTGGTLTAAAASGSITYSGGSVAAGASCTISVDVRATAASILTNTTGNLTSSLGNSGTATSMIRVNPPPTFNKNFAPDPIIVGGVSTLTFTIDNAGSNKPANSLSMTDSLPAGIVVATPSNASKTCPGGTLTAVAGSDSITLSGSSLVAGASCSVTVNVRGTAAGTHTNTTGNLTSSLGDSGTASDTLVVVGAPAFSKSFSPDTIGLNESSTLTFTINNSDNALPASSLAFTDTFPEGIVIAAVPNASTTCAGGVLNAAAGTINVGFSGGSVAAFASCTVQLDVTSGSVGSHLNVSGALTSSLGNSGSASATLTAQLLSFDKSFLPDTIGIGSVSTLTFEIENLSGNPVSDISFTDNLPTGVTIAAPANASSSCGGTVTAPNGGITIAISAGGIGAHSTCSVSVDVTSSVAGLHTNVTSQLLSSGGTTAAAMAELLVETDRPGFTKRFSPSTIPFGARSALTFTIDNSANEESAATNLDFTDDLPPGIVIASPANALTTCTGGVLTAVPGAAVIGYTGGSVGVLESCTISVDVIGEGVGVLGNTTGELTSEILLGDEFSTVVSSGKASAVLTVTGARIGLVKSFTNDPVLPGGTVNTQFVITNFDRSTSATNITFTDNLTATLAGLVKTGPALSNICGTGSSLSGTSVLTFSGGSLAAGASCTIDVALQVPATAATGVYTNTTSSIAAKFGTQNVTGSPATDNLFVQTVPVITKSFTNDPVGAGGSVNLNFNIRNTSTTSSAVDIAFTDTLLPGLTVTAVPSGGFCGAGSSLISQLVDETETLIMTGGILPAGGSCNFDVTLLVSAGAPGGPFTNTTSPLTATVGGSPVTGSPASDDLVIVAAPSLRKEFTNDPAVPGANTNLRFTLTYGSEGTVGNATGISFTDNLNAALSGLSAVGLPLNNICGAGSTLSGTTNLTFSGGSLTPGTSCTFDVPVKVPLASPPGTFTNTTSNVTATVSGVTTTNIPASDDLRVTGLAISKEFTDDPVPAGGTVTLQFTINNSSVVADATNITFTDNLDEALTGLVATGTPLLDICGTGSQLTGTNVLTLTGGNLAAGESCTFSVTLQVPASAASNLYSNTTSDLSAQFGAGPVTIEPATDVLIVASDLLLLTKSFAEDAASPGDTVTLDFTISNLDNSQSVTDITFTDDVDAALPGLVVVGLPASDVCGAGSSLTGSSLLTLAGGSLGPGQSCSFSATLQLPTAIPFGSIVSNTTSQATGDRNGVTVTADPASDDLQINFLEFSKAFDGLTFAGGRPKLTFTIENLTESSVDGLTFTDDLSAVIAGLSAIGLPRNGVCGPGSQLAGTPVLRLTGGNLGPGGTCTFDVTLQVPLNAAPGTFTNVTSDLLLGSTAAASPAVDSLTVVPPPGFGKAFTPSGIPLTGTSTLRFTIDNSASPLGATSLAFTDILPAGVVIASPQRRLTTCTGGTLTIPAGSNTATYTGGAVAGGASCFVQFNVTSSVSGSHLNVSGDLTSSLGNSGPASATLISQIMLMGGPFTPGPNVLTSSKGLSDALNILIRGTQPGNAQLTSQGVTFTTAFADPVEVAFAETGVDGMASFVFNATAEQVGQTLQFQVFQLKPVLDGSIVLSVAVVDAPLLAEGGEAVTAQGESPIATALTPAMLRRVVARAIERWEGVGLTQAEIDLLHSITVEIADLPNGMLGQTARNTISIDYSAAGHGWFVDETSGDGTEFGTELSQTERGANSGGPADRRMDLFTAVLHEFGHILNFRDTSPGQSLRGVMTAELPTSVRRLPTRWQNPSQILDVNDDGSVSPLDGLILINEMNEPRLLDAFSRLPLLVPSQALRRFLDTNGDGFLTAVDVLRIFNHLNDLNVPAVAESEAPQHAVDFALLGLQAGQPSATTPAPRRTASVRNTDRDAPSSAFQSIPNHSDASDSRSTASRAATTDSDLALLEWLEQESGDNDTDY